MWYLDFLDTIHISVSGPKEKQTFKHRVRFSLFYHYYVERHRGWEKLQIFIIRILRKQLLVMDEGCKLDTAEPMTVFREILVGRG